MKMGKYIWVNVEIDVNKPLCLVFPLKLKNGKERQIDVKYKRLPSFCFGCGNMGHEIRLCKADEKMR